MMKSTETKQDASKIHKYEWLAQGYAKPVRIICDDYLAVLETGEIDKHVIVAYFVDGFGECFTSVKPSKLEKFNKFKKLKQDTLIWVRVSNGNETYHPRYFSHCEGDMVYFFANGNTSIVSKHYGHGVADLECIHQRFCMTAEDHYLQNLYSFNKTKD